MARPRTIDRQAILEAAERVVIRDGVAALSFGSVATSAGVAKATVQSAFGSRESLIEAMLERWATSENVRLESMVGGSSSSGERIAAHVRITGAEAAEVNTRVAALLAALAGTGVHSRSITQWYRQRVGDLTTGENLTHSQRLAFLAGEGALLLRHLVGFDFSEAVWNEIFAELEDMAAS